MRDFRQEGMQAKLIEKARALSNALEAVINAYQAITGEKQKLNLELQNKLSEVSNTSVWAFKGYYSYFSLANYFTKYLSKNPIQGTVVQDNPTLSQSSIKILCKAFDLPLACIAGILGGGAKSLQNSALIANQVVLHQIRNYQSKREINSSRRSYLGLLTLQQEKIGNMLKEFPVDCAQLSESCYKILTDLDKLINNLSTSEFIIGEGYLTKNSFYVGMRHYMTGASRLADILQRDVLTQFHFKDELEFFVHPYYGQYLHDQIFDVMRSVCDSDHESKAGSIYPRFDYAPHQADQENEKKVDSGNDNNSNMRNPL